jgi:hypothetical protein
VFIMVNTVAGAPGTADFRGAATAGGPILTRL